ncbi:histidinol-phosphatase [Hyphomicrobiales bacterium]|jgi:histidinol phosphatase-like enzyme (inositol monophosphatase family)|nr:histidinol-phosphatase [Rhodobiaceae bacterium]MBT5640504.1 histidinol-phosphatase [Rhodobiaceae bacterium]MDB4128178.1 histidinol-phosphatase [Hyphomicrobiales bacterium]MDC3272919.1 histidinol-phosphatase [Hyphomicrobiales bacterium]
MQNDYIFRFMNKLADDASNISKSYFKKELTLENKADVGEIFDPVTEIDKKIELAIRELIETSHPGHSIYGEEMGIKDTNSEYCWFIDPIDGTRSFVSGVPLWGTLIGLEYNTKPSFGVIDHPCLDERYIAIDGKAFLIKNGKSDILRTSNCQSLNEARLGFTSYDMFKTRNDQLIFDSIYDQVKITRSGGDCYFYSLLASGHMDIIIESSLQPYDIVAIIPLIEAAGGFISSWDGGSPNRGGSIVASASQDLHSQAIDILKNFK